MTPLQWIAMGLVLVVLEASFGGYDAVPDPLGWVMVGWGLLGLRGHVDGLRLPLGLAGVALVLSVVTYPPVVADRLSAGVGWALSLPQLAFGFALCVVLAPVVGDLGGRFRALRWVFVVLAVLPGVALASDVVLVTQAVAFAVAVAHVYVVYLLFRASSRVPAVEPAADPR